MNQRKSAYYRTDDRPYTRHLLLPGVHPGKQPSVSAGHTKSYTNTNMGFWNGIDEPKERTSGLPNWVLTPAEEKKVLEEYQKEVWKRCDPYVYEFRKCEHYAGLGVFFKCRAQAKAMKDCVNHHHQHEYVDEVRDAFIQKKLAQMKEDEDAKAKQ